MKYYLRMEGVNLSNFVYDTQDLSTVRGGGLLLLDAVDRVELQLESLATEITSISTGASSGLFEFKSDNGEQVCELVKKFLNDDIQLKHATFVIDVIEAGKDEEFSQKKEKLIAMNRWQQMQSPSLAVPSVFTGGKTPCTTDLIRPLSPNNNHQGKDGRVSVSVHQRRKYGLDNKRGAFYTNLPKYREQLPDNQKALVPLSIEAQDTVVRLSSPQFNDSFTKELDELSSNTDYGNLHNKIAVIYADGNSFGKRQQNFSITTQKGFDLLLKAYRSSFLLELLSRIISNAAWKNNGKSRIETLLWGGDEFMLVVPAWKGWETLQLFYELSATWTFENEPLTHSAGLVYCHHNAPIHRIKTLAHDLAEVCKKKSVVGEKGNYFAYQVLESFDHITGDVGKYLANVSIDNSVRSMILDGPSMGEIAQQIGELKNDSDFARGRVYTIVKALCSGNIETADTEIDKINKTINKDSVLTLEQLSKLLHENNRWMHIADLWNYIEPKEVK